MIYDRKMETVKTRLSNHERLYRFSCTCHRYLSAIEWFILTFAGYIPCQTIRKGIYRMMGMKIGKGTVIFGKAEVRMPGNIVIGNNVAIGHGAILDGRGGIEIGNNVNFSTGVWLWTAQHDVNDPYFSMSTGRIVIEDYAWLSCRTTVLPDTSIARGAVVAAGAVVTKDVPPFKIVAGVPAQVIGERNRDLRYRLEDFTPMI
ncbi:MAG: acyltransferase [Dehalococcoidia bacterium]|nr:acyltransferase [Dehalococcoidia bacterium]